MKSPLPMMWQMILKMKHGRVSLTVKYKKSSSQGLSSCVCGYTRFFQLTCDSTRNVISRWPILHFIVLSYRLPPPKGCWTAVVGFCVRKNGILIARIFFDFFYYFFYVIYVNKRKNTHWPSAKVLVVAYRILFFCYAKLPTAL